VNAFDVRLGSKYDETLCSAHVCFPTVRGLAGVHPFWTMSAPLTNTIIINRAAKK
jgi:hypothetical protein